MFLKLFQHKKKKEMVFRCSKGHISPLVYKVNSKGMAEFCPKCYFEWLEESALKAGVSQGQWVDTD